jgi:hypothetical protein
MYDKWCILAILLPILRKFTNKIVLAPPARAALHANYETFKIHFLCIANPRQAKAKAMPGWLYTHTINK